MHAAGLILLAGTLALSAAAIGRTADLELAGVANPAQARTDYILKCQGCHRPSGTGDAHTTPSLAGEVARFLAVKGGREFLSQVPGVAMTDLDDRRVAQLLNWTLYTYDAGHVPKDFQPYSAEEVGRLREQPLRLDRLPTRERLVAAMQDRTHETDK